MPNQRFKG